MKVFSIAVALAAILFVAYALPHPGLGETNGPNEEEAGAPEGENGEETGEGEGEYEGEGEETTTPDPCEEFESQCTSNEEAMSPGHDNGDNASNGTLGNTTPSPHCEALQKQCSSQNNSTMPGGYTKPTQPPGVSQPGTQQPTQPSQPSMPTTHAPVPTTPGIPNAGGRRRR